VFLAKESLSVKLEIFAAKEVTQAGLTRIVYRYEASFIRRPQIPALKSALIKDEVRQYLLLP
jgi:hypothetical protein